MDLHALVRDYLDEAKLLQIVSCSDSQPWLAHVWFARDDALNLYWMSREDRRHSREIRESSRIAGGIVLPEFAGLGDTVRGITFEGKARELEDGGTASAFKHYRGRWPNVEELVRLDDLVAGSTPMRFYVAEPTRFVLFDELNFPDQPRQEYIPATG